MGAATPLISRLLLGPFVRPADYRRPVAEEAAKHPPPSRLPDAGGAARFTVRLTMAAEVEGQRSARWTAGGGCDGVPHSGSGSGCGV